MMKEVPKQVDSKHPPVIQRVRFDDKQNIPPKTLHYFTLQMLGELPRLCLEYTRTPYDSVMYFFPGDYEYKKFAPFGQMPCYEDPELGEDGVYISQSSSICRHIAQETGIAGATASERVLQDMLWEAGKDIGEKKSALHTDEVDTRLDGVLKGLMKLQVEGKCLGTGDRSNDLGYGEIGVFHALYSFHLINDKFLATSSYAKLLSFVNSVLAVPAIKNYLASPRRIPLTKNELGRGHTGLEGYTYVSELSHDTLAEKYVVQ